MKKILLVLVLIVAGLAGYIATRPPEFTITRSRTVAAPPEVVFGFVNDFSKWPEWSPWEKKDPAMKKEMSSPSAGTGATYGWSGNKDVGEGRMTITDSAAPRSLAIKLEFFKPWTATSATQFDFSPEGAGTKVTWTMSGRNNFISRAMCLFMNMDKMVGGDFEKGLASLDEVTAAVKPVSVPAPAAEKTASS